MRRLEVSTDASEDHKAELASDGVVNFGGGASVLWVPANISHIFSILPFFQFYCNFYCSASMFLRKFVIGALNVHCVSKTWCRTFAITSSTVNRFWKLFHCWIIYEIQYFSLFLKNLVAYKFDNVRHRVFWNTVYKNTAWWRRRRWWWCMQILNFLVHEHR